MASFNKVILIGNMTADPELKQTTSGISVCTFSIAINRRFAKEGEQNVDFISIVAWRQQAEFVSKYFKKGMPILICGQLQTRTWTDNQGQKRYATEVVADEVSFVGNNGSSKEEKSETEQAKSSTYVPAAYTQPAMNIPPSPHFEELKGDEPLPF